MLDKEKIGQKAQELGQKAKAAKAIAGLFGRIYAQKAKEKAGQVVDDLKDKAQAAAKQGTRLAEETSKTITQKTEELLTQASQVGSTIMTHAQNLVTDLSGKGDETAVIRVEPYYIADSPITHIGIAGEEILIATERGFIVVEDGEQQASHDGLIIRCIRPVGTGVAICTEDSVSIVSPGEDNSEDYKYASAISTMWSKGGKLFVLLKEGTIYSPHRQPKGYHKEGYKAALRKERIRIPQNMMNRVFAAFEYNPVLINVKEPYEYLLGVPLSSSPYAVSWEHIWLYVGSKKTGDLTGIKGFEEPITCMAVGTGNTVLLGFGSGAVVKVTIS